MSLKILERDIYASLECGTNFRIQVVYYNKNGALTPVNIVWDEDHVYDIDAIKHVEKTGIWENGRESFKYTCIINGKVAHLYYGPDRWYVYPPEK